jgi:hypothetical protein
MMRVPPQVADAPARRNLSTVALVVATTLLLSACAKDTIQDRRYGQQVVCHDGKTLTVSNADSFVHLDHGDSPGPCPGD